MSQKHYVYGPHSWRRISSWHPFYAGDCYALDFGPRSCFSDVIIGDDYFTMADGLNDFDLPPSCAKIDSRSYYAAGE